MELALDQIIRSSAFVIAVSPNESRLAVSGERKITVFSLPAFKKEYTIPVMHADYMIFLDDNCSMLILNTTGGCFLWSGSTLESIGKWPVPQQESSPLFFAGKNTAVWAGCGGVWKYDITERHIKKLLSIDGEPFICRVCDGIIRLVTLEYNKSRQCMDIYQLDYNGAILHHCKTKNRLWTNIFGKPCWNNDDMITISTVSTTNGIYAFLYLIDSKNGDVLIQKCDPCLMGTGDCYCGNGLIARVLPVTAETVTIYADDNLKPLYQLDKTVLDERNNINPPTMVYFLKNGKILIGSWRRLFVYDVIKHWPVDDKTTQQNPSL